MRSLAGDRSIDRCPIFHQNAIYFQRFHGRWPKVQTFSLKSKKSILMDVCQLGSICNHGQNAASLRWFYGIRPKVRNSLHKCKKLDMHGYILWRCNIQPEGRTSLMIAGQMTQTAELFAWGKEKLNLSVCIGMRFDMLRKCTREVTHTTDVFARV